MSDAFDRCSFGPCRVPTDKDEPALGSAAGSALVSLSLEPLNPAHLSRHGFGQHHFVAAHYATHQTTLNSGNANVCRIGVSATGGYCRGSTVISNRMRG